MKSSTAPAKMRIGFFVKGSAFNFRELIHHLRIGSGMVFH